MNTPSLRKLSNKSLQRAFKPSSAWLSGGGFPKRRAVPSSLALGDFSSKLLPSLLSNKLSSSFPSVDECAFTVDAFHGLAVAAQFNNREKNISTSDADSSAMVDTLMLYAFAPLSSHLRVFVSS